MLNSKQRAKLRSLASTYEPMIIIGKDGLTDNILEQIDKQLFAHEMVKISVLDERRNGKELFEAFDTAAYSTVNFGMFHGDIKKVHISFPNYST